MRTVDRADIRDGTVAPGSTPRAKAALWDFHRLTDGEAFPEDEIAPYDTADAEGLQVFVPN